MGNFHIIAGEAFDGPAKNAEAGGAGGFFAGFEKKLVADANSKVGFS